MAIFGLLPFERFDALLQRVDQSFEAFDVLLLKVNSLDRLFEPFTQVLIRLTQLFQLVVFAMPCCTQGRILLSQVFQFFFTCHAATLADCSSSRNCLALLNRYGFYSDPSPPSYRRSSPLQLLHGVSEPSVAVIAQGSLAGIVAGQQPPSDCGKPLPVTPAQSLTA